MTKLKLAEVVVQENISIKNAMRQIDASGLRVVYVVDKNQKFLGVISDSEVRKAIIKGIDIKEKISSIINLDPIVIKYSDLNNKYLVQSQARKLLTKMPDNEYILALDNNNRPFKLIPTYKLALHFGQTKSSKKVRNHGKRILVVGGAGYLGSVLVTKLLRRGYKVRILDLLLYGKKHLQKLLHDSRLELVIGDMQDISFTLKSLENVDAVINLAAIVGDPACKVKPELTVGTNYLANKALADACKYHQINRFLYASTCSVYGLMDQESELSESSPLNPVSLYARSKIESEEGVLRLLDDNFSPTILRMSTLYGYSPRMRFDLVLNAMTKSAVMDRKIYVHGGGKQWRPMLNIEDAADAYIKCLEAPLHKVKGQIFNVGSDEQNYQIIDIAKIVHEGVPSSEIVVQGDEQDVRNYKVSFNKIKNDLNFHVKRDLKQSVLKIRKLIETKVLTNLNNPIYYNVDNFT